jgi:hypothetical protein
MSLCNRTEIPMVLRDSIKATSDARHGNGAQKGQQDRNRSLGYKNMIRAFGVLQVRKKTGNGR